MSDILDKIMVNVHGELEKTQPNKKLFMDAFKEKNASIIGEIKIASPKYDLSATVKPEELIKYYAENPDIKAMSILINEKFFKGDIARAKIAKPYGKPLFFKEFVANERQLDGAAYFGFDAALILKRILTWERVKELSIYANTKNICPVIEVDCEEDLRTVFALDLACDFAIGINCRNLGTMEIDRNVHFLYPEKYKQDFAKHIIFAFSGVDRLEQVAAYKGLYNGVLIGTYYAKKFAEGK